MAASPNPCGPALLRWYSQRAPDTSPRLAVAYSAGADSTALLLAAHALWPGRVVAIRIRVEQATPVRAAVLTRDGVWHVGSARVDAAGGGCTAPSVVRAQPGWEDRLGEVIGGRFVRGDFSRLRLQVSHPMDNGLVGDIPEFFLNQAELRAADGQVLAALELYPAVAENPSLSLEVKGEQGTRLWLRDNNGNEFEAAL